MKNYAIRNTEENEVHYIETITPTNIFTISGTSKINMWGGGTGIVEMDESSFETNELTKKVIYENLNDGQFGCSSIESGVVFVSQEMKVERQEIVNGNPTGVVDTFKIHEPIVYELKVSQKDALKKEVVK